MNTPLKTWTALGLAVAALSTLPAPARAQQSLLVDPARPYILGAAVGMTHLRVGCAGTLTCDRNGTGFQVVGGWQSPTGWRLEAAYHDWGRADARRWLDGRLIDGDLRARGGSLALAYVAPLDTRWLLSARGGLAYHRTRVAYHSADAPVDDEISDTRGHFDPLIGVGLGYRLTPTVTLEGALHWTRLSLPAPADTLFLRSHAQAHQLGVGLNFGF